MFLPTTTLIPSRVVQEARGQRASGQADCAWRIPAPSVEFPQRGKPKGQMMGAIAKACLILIALLAGGAAQAADPIKIGFSAQLTGSLASSGKANLLAQQIWAEEVNAKGGLLGRPVQ